MLPLIKLLIMIFVAFAFKYPEINPHPEDLLGIQNDGERRPGYSKSYVLKNQLETSYQYIFERNLTSCFPGSPPERTLSPNILYTPNTLMH